MKDLNKRKRFKIMGFMFKESCPCCNWTRHGNIKKNKRIVGKQIRAKLKQDLRVGEE